MIRHCTADDFDRILTIINDAAQAYRGVIPDDRWKEPYMPAGDLAEELAADISRKLFGQVPGGHVRLLPPIVRYDPAIGLGGIVDNREDAVEVVRRAVPDHGHLRSLRRFAASQCALPGFRRPEGVPPILGPRRVRGQSGLREHDATHRMLPG